MRAIAYGVPFRVTYPRATLSRSTARPEFRPLFGSHERRSTGGRPWGAGGRAFEAGVGPLDRSLCLAYAACAILRQLSAHIRHISAHPFIISSSAMRSQASEHRAQTSAQTAHV